MKTTNVKARISLCPADNNLAKDPGKSFSVKSMRCSYLPSRTDSAVCVVSSGG